MDMVKEEKEALKRNEENNNADKDEFFKKVQKRWKSNRVPNTRPNFKPGNINQIPGLYLNILLY